MYTRPLSSIGVGRIARVWEIDNVPNGERLKRLRDMRQKFTLTEDGRAAIQELQLELQSATTS